ncbi:MAG: glycosyltransferase [Myxococcota bacterium]
MISVVLPARNASATLGRALDSLLEQTQPATEVLVVDDHSTDETAQIATDRGVRVLRPNHRGLVAALNHGVRSAREPWIARMDADDYSEPTRFERQLELIGAYDVIGTQVRIVGGGEGFLRYAEWQNGLTTHQSILRERFVESPLAHPTVLLRRELLLSAGLYQDHDWPEDYELWLRLAEGGARFAKVPAELVHWADHPERASRTDPRYREAAFIDCKAHYLAKGPLRQNRAVIWGAGSIGKRLGRSLEERGVRLEYFVDIDEKKLGRSARGRPILAPERLRPESGRVLLAAVGVRGARELIREHATSFGFSEGKDFFCAA